jgi:hypothetical protein
MYHPSYWHFPTWIVHEIALADVNASGVERVIVFMVVDVVVVVNGTEV